MPARELSHHGFQRARRHDRRSTGFGHERCFLSRVGRRYRHHRGHRGARGHRCRSPHRRDGSRCRQSPRSLRTEREQGSALRATRDHPQNSPAARSTPTCRLHAERGHPSSSASAHRCFSACRPKPWKASPHASRSAPAGSAVAPKGSLSTRRKPRHSAWSKNSRPMRVASSRPPNPAPFAISSASSRARRPTIGCRCPDMPGPSSIR